ncbi:GntR family transcriptional regulator [Carnobacterium maltaromaticum]|uniref:GntR family transcriptional regulator n=1 Tax=Carnobacterium maltaromaticum TaxID=2751 RepID=UPI0039BE35CE
MERGNNLETVAYLTIKEKIITKEWPPQAHLTEVKTAKLLGISRTPVRKAFFKLESEGYLMIEAHKGAKILEQKIDVRGYLERLEFLELLFVQQIHFIELKEIQLDFSKLDASLNELFQLVELNDPEVYQGKELDLLKDFLGYGRNQFKTALVIDTLRNLHLQKNHEIETLMKRTLAKKLQHYSKTLDLLRKKEYGLARKQVRIMINQLMLSAVTEE